MKYNKLRLMIYQYLRPNISRLFLIFCLLLLSAVTSLVIPLFYKKIIDIYIPAKQILPILISIILLAVVLLGQRYIDFLETKLSSTLKRDIFIKLKMDIYNRIQDLPLNYYINNMSGNILSKFIFDAENTEIFFNNTALLILRDILFILALIPFMFFINVKITIIAIFLIPLSFIIYKIYSRNLLILGQKLSRNIEEYTGNLQENISLIKFIKSYNLQTLKESELVEKIRKVEEKKQDIQIKSAKYFMTSIITLIAINFIIWGFGSYQVLSGYLTLGSLIAISVYFNLAIQPFSRAYSNILNYPRFAGSLERLAEILSLKVEENKEAGIVLSKSKWNSLSLVNVTFGYNINSLILRNINMEFKEGSCTLIEGANGSGKTTLFHLLLRFYTPNSGKICLNDRPIDEYNLSSYRKLFSVVYQEPVIFNASITNNIILFNKDVDPKKFEEVINITRLDLLRDQSSEGLETVVGENGVKLSGGQKQKICLARALLTDSPFIILDEATANVDEESEIEIISALQNIIGEKTVIIIGHRFPKHLLPFDSIYELGVRRYE